MIIIELKPWSKKRKTQLSLRPEVLALMDRMPLEGSVEMTSLFDVWSTKNYVVVRKCLHARLLFYVPNGEVSRHKPPCGYDFYK